MDTKITDLPTIDQANLIDEMARSMAEADGILYWKFDAGDGRANYELLYRGRARRHLAAHRILSRRAQIGS